jgi:PIN domain nuclease of toxin-antitoxin system
LSVLLDTHIWIWWLTPGSPLSEQDRAALDKAAARERLCLAAISLWEAQILHAKERIMFPVPFSEWLRRTATPDVLNLLPLDIEVVLALDALPRRFHGDPADRLIVATALVHGLALATHDKDIRRSRVVKLWKP